MEKYFVPRGSIVRRIWGSSETVLLIFAGASAEFALNRSVDWLYFTGRLPADPIGRLFSTVRYAQAIVFATEDRALAAIDQIAGIHRGVEASRGMRIPDSAYLDVLFLLIDYSIRSFELLERKLSDAEKGETYAVFFRLGERMGLVGLPGDYPGWERMRAEYLATNLVRSDFTVDLYRRYRKSLGTGRYRLLLYGQALLAPARVRRLLGLRGRRLVYPLVGMYRVARMLRLDRWIRAILLPREYKTQIAGLDVEVG